MGGMMPERILDFLRTKGEQMDRDIAAGLGLSLAHVHSGLDRLATQGDIVLCRSIRYQDGRQVEGMRCRLATYLPATFPGRRSY
jgi:predicted ArsR family transcriptional regulator